MSRLIFFAQPDNIEWALAKLNGTIQIFSQTNELPGIANVLFIHDVSFSTDILNEYSEDFKKSHHNIRWETLKIPTLDDFPSWSGEFRLRPEDLIILPHPGILFGRVLHEIVHSFDFRDGTILFGHPSPDGKNYAIYSLKKASSDMHGPPDIEMKKYQLQMEQNQTLKNILEKSSNGDFKTIHKALSVPSVHQNAIDIEAHGTFVASEKHITQEINSISGLGFEEVTGSLLSTNQSLTEIYHSVYFGTDNRNSQEEDFFVMTKSQEIIWISCKFINSLNRLKKEVLRLRLKPPIQNIPKQRIHSIVATSRHLAENYASTPPNERTPGVDVCHLGNLNEKISQISNREKI